MGAVKDITSSGEKWSTRASGAATEFEQNTIAAADLWGRNTQAAMGNYKAGISQAGIEQRFSRGVARAAQQGKFVRKVRDVAGGRYSQGVGVAKQDWVQGFEPFHGVLQTVSYPARRPRGDIANLERVKTVTSALHAKRIALLASS